MSTLNRLLSTYRSGGLHAVYNESRRYWRDHPTRILQYARVRTAKLAWLSAYTAVADPTKLLYVSPDRITRVSDDFSTSADVGRIVDGDWDRHTTDFTEKIRYQAIRQRYEDGDRWEDTGIYEYYLTYIETRGRYDGCYTLEDVKQRYKTVDQMYESMKETGYDESRVENVLDHVCVNISRDGELLHDGVGNHRLSIAKLLDLDEIPVRVVVRHKKWQQKRERLNAGEDDVSHSDLHPDLQDCL